jgi:hypothetical protein
MPGRGLRSDLLFPNIRPSSQHRTNKPPVARLAGFRFPLKELRRESQPAL